jgi:hypothetical protein
MVLAGQRTPMPIVGKGGGSSAVSRAFLDRFRRVPGPFPGGYCRGFLSKVPLFL